MGFKAWNFLNEYMRWGGRIGASIGIILGAALPADSADAPNPDVEKEIKYAVVESRATYNTPGWKEAGDELVKKHRGRLILYDDEIERTLPELKEMGPDFVGYVARPEEVSVRGLGQNVEDEFAHANGSNIVRLKRILRLLDSDPYPDAIDGVITGLTPEDAMRQVRAANLEIGTVLGKGFENPIYRAVNGVVFSEARQGPKNLVKRLERGNSNGIRESYVESAGNEFIAALNQGNVDLVGINVHGSCSDVSLGYNYPDLWLVAKGGQTYAVDPATKTAVARVDSPNPKAYISTSTCEFAGIKDPQNALALSLIHSGGSVQYVGRMLTVWGIDGITANYIGHGYKFFLLGTSANPSIADAVKMAEISNEFALQRLRGKSDGRSDIDQLEIYDKLHGEHTMVLYGDPALSARMKGDKFDSDVAEEVSMKENPDGTCTYRLSVKTLKPNTTVERPPVFLLRKRIDKPKGVKVTPEGTGYLVADDFAIINAGEDIVMDPKLGPVLKHPQIAVPTEWTLEFDARPLK